MNLLLTSSTTQTNLPIMNFIRTAKIFIIVGSVFAFLKTYGMEFEAPSWANSSSAEYSVWETFSIGFGEPGNTPDVAGSNGGGTITQATPGGSVTGSGNIYNPGGASKFTLSNGANRDYQTVLLQVKSIGSLATDTVTLTHESDGQPVEIMADMSREVARESGGFGDTIIHLWSWDLSELSVSNIQIDFGAQGPHLSLDAVRFDALLEEAALRVAQIERTSVDRWNYPFNATPGKRPKASVFRSVEEGIGVFRHGYYVFGFDTDSMIPAGHVPSAYAVESIRIKVLTSAGFESPYDPTYDSAVSYLPADHPNHEEDSDLGRPVELFGTGFRNDLDVLTWTEDAPYAPNAEADPSVFPAVMNEQGAMIDVSLAVDYGNPIDIMPFATGIIQSAVPADRIPEETWMEFDLDLRTSNALAYVQQGLSEGRMMFTATGLSSGGHGERSFPEFHTADSLLGESPSIVITYHLTETPSKIQILAINQNGNQWILTGTTSGDMNLGIRWTEDFAEWKEIIDPVFETTEEGHWTWTDSGPNNAKKFYQVYTR